MALTESLQEGPVGPSDYAMAADLGQRQWQGLAPCPAGILPPEGALVPFSSVFVNRAGSRIRHHLPAKSRYVGTLCGFGAP